MAGKRDFGQIFRLKGKWVVRWRERGRVLQKTIGISKDLAARFLAKKQADLSEEDVLGRAPVDPVRFENLVEQYEKLFAGEKEPATVIREAMYFRNKIVPFFRGLNVGAVRRADVERFLAKRSAEDKVSGGTRNKMLNMLSTFFKKAMALDHARENPCAGIRRQQEALKAVPYVTVEGQECLVEKTPEPLRHFVALLLDSGLRLAEGLRLEWKDVDFRRHVVTVRVAKNKTSREVPFTTRGRQALMAIARERPETPRVPDLVFPMLVDYSNAGEPRLKTWRRREWNKAGKAAGLPGLRIHDLRHVWAVTCVRAGVSLGELRELGGWRGLEMVLRYSRHVPANTPDLARERLQKFLAIRETGHASGHGSGA